MKKLMIAACAVAFAAVAQAAQVNWAATDVVGSPRDGGEQQRYYTGYTFFTELGGATEYSAVTMSQIEMLAQAGNWAALDELAVNKYSAPGDSSYASSTAWAAASTGNPITVKGFTLLVDADLLDAGEPLTAIENYALSAEGTVKFQSGTAWSTFENSFSASEWKAVPEPTSGLLLLIGVAGLALRRRRA